MPMELSQGVQQDHRGRAIKLGSWPATSSKTVIVPWTQPELRAETQMLLEPVVVESKAYEAALTIQPQTPEQEQALKAIIARGPTYISCQLYQLKRSI